MASVTKGTVIFLFNRWTEKARDHILLFPKYTHKQKVLKDMGQFNMRETQRPLSQIRCGITNTSLYKLDRFDHLVDHYFPEILVDLSMVRTHLNFEGILIKR